MKLTDKIISEASVPLAAKINRVYLNERILKEGLSGDIVSEFKAEKNFTKRKKIADQNFKKLNNGTSRNIYIVENDILKLAKNKKGIAQNKTEIKISESHKFNNIIANVLDFDSDGLYLIQQKAIPITPARFEQITG